MNDQAPEGSLQAPVSAISVFPPGAIGLATALESASSKRSTENQGSGPQRSAAF
jgi:hypothetical protein